MNHDYSADSVGVVENGRETDQSNENKDDQITSNKGSNSYNNEDIKEIGVMDLMQAMLELMAVSGCLNFNKERERMRNLNQSQQQSIEKMLTKMEGRIDIGKGNEDKNSEGTESG